MKSIICISTSVRAACRHASACSVLHRGLSIHSSVDRCTNVDLAIKTVVAQQPCASDVRCFQRTRSAAATPLPTPVPIPGERHVGVTLHQTGRHMTAPPRISAYTPYTKPQSNTVALVNIQSLFQEDVMSDLCSRLAHLPSSDRAEGLATLLGACVEFGLEAQSPPVIKLMNECLELLSTGDIEVEQLCHLGRVAYSLEGRRSHMATKVFDSLSTAVEKKVVSPSKAAEVYSLLTLFYEPSSQQQALMLSALHRHTQRQVHQLKTRQIGDILQSLVKLQQRQAIALVLRLSHRASRVFKYFSDDEIIKVLSALMTLGQHKEQLLAAMEKHLPGRLGTCDPEVISTVMEYCLQIKCRSEPIFEAVAENFVCNAERHTDLQIAKQIVAMGRLNYLPQCSGPMFKKLESILSTRFVQFQPRSLIALLHACIHLERFPLNYMDKVFSPHFLQRLQAQTEPLDKNTIGELTQLHLSASLECTHYSGPNLPFFVPVKRFSSVDQAFETPVERLLYRQVRGPLARLLGGTIYFHRICNHNGYTIDVEVCLDENGFVLPFSQWEYASKRLALCLDGEDRFCSNTRFLLGKEVTKRRHLSRMGYEVVQVPYYEFEKLKTQKEKVQYLQNKIFPTITKFSC